MTTFGTVTIEGTEYTIGLDATAANYTGPNVSPGARSGFGTVVFNTALTATSE
jgi:hypothetical protein